ncbi:flagellar M-ring protein FliF [Caminibacter profundus]
MENGKLKKEIKYKIIKDRLRNIFAKRPKSIAKILTHIIQRQKSV